jgi:hypothetical protein
LDNRKTPGHIEKKAILGEGMAFEWRRYYEQKTG